MKVLITGGAGFIGSHLVERLLLESIDITVLDNFSTGRRENVPDSIHLIETDMKSPELSNLFRREKFDALIHLAAQTTVAYSIESPLDDAQENIIGTLNLLRASNDNGIERFIFASSAAIYGNVPEDFLPIREDMRPVPLSFYGLSKLTAEKYIELHHSTYGLNYIILRFSNVFGEKQGDSGEGGVISIFSKRIATTDRGGGSSFRRRSANERFHSRLGHCRRNLFGTQNRARQRDLQHKHSNGGRHQLPSLDIGDDFSKEIRRRIRSRAHRRHSSLESFQRTGNLQSRLEAANLV